MTEHTTNSMEENKEHTQHLDEIINKVLANDRDGVAIVCNGSAKGQMRNAFRKVASAAMMDGFENGYQIGYDSGFKHGATTSHDPTLRGNATSL